MPKKKPKPLTADDYIAAMQRDEGFARIVVDVPPRVKRAFVIYCQKHKTTMRDVVLTMLAAKGIR